MSIKCTEVIVTPITSLYCRVSGGTKSIIPHKIKDKLVSLELPSNKIISLKDIIKVKGNPYKVNIIEKNFDSKILYYDLKIAERTKSSLFVMPMMGGNRRLFLYDKQFLNCFIGFNDYDDCIVLLYRWSSDPLFEKFHAALQTFKDFLITYSPDPYHVLYVFSIPEEHIENFRCFKDSKYSKMDDMYKLKVLDYHDMDIEGVLAQILFKSEIRRQALQEKLDAEISKDSELLSLIKPEQEILNLKTYINGK
tara:strand:- start:1947 stop:2699 length:753 start_codon:yes stop_codon:yes gene_type:complete